MTDTRWSPFGRWLAVLGLMTLAGCGTIKPTSKGSDGHEPPAAAQATAKPAEEKQAAKTEVTPPSPPATPTEAGGYRLATDDPKVKERLALFEGKKGVWDETAARLTALGGAEVWPESWAECLQDIHLALAGYRRLQAGQDRELKPWEVIGRDVQYFEKGCDQVLTVARDKVSGKGTPAAPLPTVVSDGSEELVRQHYEAGRYQEALAVYETLAGQRDGAQIPRTAKLYACRALVKLGRLADAAGRLSALLQEPGQANDLTTFEIRALAADVLLAVGQVDAARQVYEGQVKALTPLASQQAWAEAHAQAFAGEPVNAEEMALYRELLRAYLAFDGQRLPSALIEGAARLEGRKGSPLAELARMIENRARAQAQAWARGQLTEVRALLDAHDVARARELVDQVAAAAPDEMKPAISQLQAEVAQAEAAKQTLPTTEGQAPVPVDSWAEAVTLFEQKKFDEAIAAFQKLVDGEHGAEAKAKMAEAAEQAAAAVRQQAAALYAKAKKTLEPETRRQTLLSSRTLLLELLAKYPETSVVPKARQNLKVLETELGPADTPVPPNGNPADGSGTSRP